MRPIAYGVIVFMLAAILSILVSFLAGFEEGLTGSTGLMPLVWACDLTLMLCLPAAVVVEVVCWRRRRRKI